MFTVICWVIVGFVKVGLMKPMCYLKESMNFHLYCPLVLRDLVEIICREMSSSICKFNQNWHRESYTFIVGIN